VTKNYCKNYHGNGRLNDDPGDSDNRLLIADDNVSPDEEAKKLPTLPDAFQVNLE
jgi:hypothetical protein